MSRVLVTGSNRGIGLEFTRQLLGRDDHVFAAARTPADADALHEMQNEHGDQLTLVELDVADPDSVAAAFEQVKQRTDALDLLINNAAINPGGMPLADVTKSDFMQTFEVNVAGVMLACQQFVELLKAGDNPRIVNISSGAGSISGSPAGNYSYSVSKAALNMFNRVLYQELANDGITSIVMNPGWVVTDMGGQNANLQPEDSVRQQLQVIDSLTQQDSGSFKSYDGSELDW